MSEFSLDLQGAEDQLDERQPGVSVELGILDGTTEPGEWIEAVENGQVLVLSVQGDLNELAAGFAREIRDMGGELMHFRSFLVVTPPGVPISRERLQS